MSFSVASRVLARPLRAWARLRPILGDRTTPVITLAVVAVGAGLAEAGVLALVAQVAAVLVADETSLHLGLGPINLDLGLGVSLAVAFALAVVRMALQVVVAWLPARISADVQNRLRKDLFASFSGASWSVQAEERDGHLQELMSNQVAQATLAALNVASLLTSAAMFATLTASAFVLSVPVALSVLVGAMAMFALLRPVTAFGRHAAHELSQAEMNHAAAVNETVRLGEESRVFGTAEAQRGQVGELIETTSRAYFRYQLAGGLARTTYQSLAILLIVAGLAGLNAANVADVASLGAAVLILVRAGSYGQGLQGAYHGLHQMLPYLHRLEAASEHYRASSEPDGGRELNDIATVGFEAAGFAYRPGRPVLHDLTFEITAGEAIGVVGPSGAGKSTLVQLLLRLRTPDNGFLLVNGEPAQAFARADWQQRVAYVSQEPRVFSGTVAENIRYFRAIDDAAVEQAARLAHIHDDIVAMPSGYATLIGQRADAISGGQRQRICLARALAAQPDVLILDEPTSALDLASEAAVQQSLSELHGRVTLVIVAHRLSTLSICDKILVLADGRVEAFAKAEELVGTNEFFQQATALSGGSV